MSDANNMYEKGVREKPKWHQISAKARNRALTTLGMNKNTLDMSTSPRVLPIRHRDFEYDPGRKSIRQVDYSSLSPDTPVEEIEKHIRWIDEKAGWFHSIDLPQGISTPGGRGWENRATMYGYDKIVAGKDVLDLGSMEGGDVFAAEKAGAKSVTSMDVDNTLEYDLGRNAAWDYVVDKYIDAKNAGEEAEWIFLNAKRFGFEFCKAVLQSTARRISCNVYDLDPVTHGMFDVVFCFGLLYHIRHPILAIDRISAVTREVALFNTGIFNGYFPEKNAMLYFNDQWRGSYTNWFVPGYEAFIDMVSSSGFAKVELVKKTSIGLFLACYK